MEVAKFLMSSPDFSGLPGDVLCALSDECKPVNISARSYLFHQGEAATKGYIMVSGRAAMTKSSLNGKELIVELVLPGEPFGLVALVGSRPYPLSARICSDSVLLSIDKDSYSRLSGDFPLMRTYFYDLICKRMETAQDLARAIAHDRAEVRVASILTTILLKNQIWDSENSVINIARHEIADLTGITLETASRVTKLLEKDGILDASELGVIRVQDFKKLQQISAS